MIFGKDKADVERIRDRIPVDFSTVAIGTMQKGLSFGLIKAKLSGRRTIRRWVGTDVYKLRFPHYRWQARFTNLFVDENAFVSERLKREFRRWFPKAGVRPELWDAEPEPYKRMFTILMYLPETFKGFKVKTRWLYGEDYFLVLSKRHPEWRWIILDGHTPRDAVRELYMDVDVYFRPTRHDGSPRMIKEARLFSCPVVWSEYGMTLEKAEGELVKLYNRWVINNKMLRPKGGRK